MSDVKAPAKGLYLRASLILAALTLVGFLIAMVNEDVSMRIAAAVVFPAGVLIFSYPASLISRRMLVRSDKLHAAGKVLFLHLRNMRGGCGFPADRAGGLPRLRRSCADARYGHGAWRSADAAVRADRRRNADFPADIADFCGDDTAQGRRREELRQCRATTAYRL